MVPPLIKKLVYYMYINTYVYVGTFCMLENTTYITHWQFLPSIDIMEPILFPNNREKIVDSNVKLRKRSGLSLLLNFS